MNRVIVGLVCTLFLCLSSGKTLRATHFAGADFKYECIGQDSFLVSFNLFRDCSGIAASNTVSIDFNSPCGSFTETFQKDSITDVSQLCPAAQSNTTCFNGVFPGMQHHWFSKVIELPPCNTGAWEMSWGQCCRNPSENLVGSPNGPTFYLAATIDNDAAPCNNSPQFNAQPIPYVCRNQPVIYNFAVTETDGDSLYFRLDTALQEAGGGTPAPYDSTFHGLDPFGVPVSLDSITGQVTFTPITNGLWVIKVCVDEYRNNTLIGTICRDIQFVVQDCDNYTPYMMSPGITNYTGSGNVLGSNSVGVCAGETFSFDVFFSDSLHPGQVAGGFGDSVTLFTNIQSTLPGATVNIQNGNPAVINITWTATVGSNPLKVFYVDALDDACAVRGGATEAFSIYVDEAAFAGFDQYLCVGADTAFFTDVEGGTHFNWSVISGDPIQLGVNFIDTTGLNGDSVWSFPSQTTVYEVTSNLTAACGNKDTVTVFAARDFNLNMFGDTTICSNDTTGTFPIEVIPDTSAGSPPYHFSYQWSNPGMLSDPSISNPVVTLNTVSSTTFTVTVTSDSGCVEQGSVTINFGSYFPDSAKADFIDKPLCLGDTTTAFINLGNNIGESCGPAPQPCDGNLNQIVSGTGTSTNGVTQGNSPYTNHNNQGARTQFLYREAELAALGMSNGARIESIEFFVQAVNGIFPLENYTIKMGCTQSTTLAGGFINTGLTTVFSTDTLIVTGGWNIHKFQSQYDWSGNDNLVIEICYRNNLTSTSANASVRYTSTPFTSVRHRRSDMAGVCTLQSPTMSSSDRSNTRFNFCSGYDLSGFDYLWSPASSIDDPTADSTSAYPTTGTTYTVTVSDTAGLCTGEITGFLDVVTAYNTSFTLNSPLCHNAGPDTAQPVSPGGNFAGAGIDPQTGVFDPSTVQPDTHEIIYSRISPSGGCFSADTVEVEVLPVPDVEISGPDEFCFEGDTVQYFASDPGGIWSMRDSGSIDSAAGTIDPALLPSPGFYNVIYTIDTPCYSRDTFEIKAYLPYTAILDDSMRFVCENDFITLGYTPISDSLYGSEPGRYIWSGPGITDSVAGIFNASSIAPGDYTVVLSASDSAGGCGDSLFMQVRVLPSDTPSIADIDPFCANEGIIELDPDPDFDPASSAWFTQPISPGSDSLIITDSNTVDLGSAAPGSWIIEYLFTNDSGCTASASDTLTILPAPDLPVLSSDNYCEGDNVVISATGSDPDSVFWFLDTADFFDDHFYRGSPLSFGEAIYFDDIRENTVYVVAKDGRCYSDTVHFTVPVLPYPEAVFELDYFDYGENPVSVIVSNEEVIDQDNNAVIDRMITGLTPLDVTGTALDQPVPLGDTIHWHYKWDPENPGNPATRDAEFLDFDISNYTYEEEGIYTIRMIRVNAFGCADTTYLEVDIYLGGEPGNVFTPNGDGVNDEFYIPGARGLLDFRLSIYNRWGGLIWETEFTGVGWDGRTYSGALVSDGVYYFIARGRRPGGEEYLRKGHITVMGSGKK